LFSYLFLRLGIYFNGNTVPNAFIDCLAKVLSKITLKTEHT